MGPGNTSVAGTDSLGGRRRVSQLCDKHKHGKCG